MSHSQLPVLFLLTVQSFSIFCCKEYNQFDVGIGDLVMPMCRVFSCVLNRVFAMTVHSLGKTVLAFALLHFELQGLIFLLFHYSYIQNLHWIL